MKHIYVIDNGHGVVKIGVAKNVADRVTTIARQGGFEPVNVFYTEKCSNSYEIETSIHKQLKSFRTRGEWFEIGFREAVELVKVCFEKSAEFTPDEKEWPCASECVVRRLSETKEQVLKTLEQVIPNMTDIQLAQWIGYGEGLAAQHDFEENMEK